jgi:hypothetical protein
VPPEPPESGLLFLDACCLIDLFATGHIAAVLEVLPPRFATSELVADREVLAIDGAPAPEGSEERIRVSPRSLETSGQLAILPLASEREQAEFVRFAGDLDDGEASVCALAVVHGGGVATDDRKALRILGQAELQDPVLQTPELLFDWAQRSRASEDEIREALTRVRDRARFYPRADAPCFGWWESFFR